MLRAAAKIPSDVQLVLCLGAADTPELAAETARLIDADMRKGWVHQMLKVSNERGLSNLLSGDRSSDALIQVTTVANLSVAKLDYPDPAAAGTTFFVSIASKTPFCIAKRMAT